MGFLYGNTINHIPRSNFKFSKVYSSRWAMDRDISLTGGEGFELYGYSLINYAPSDFEYSAIKEQLLSLKQDTSPEDKESNATIIGNESVCIALFPYLATINLNNNELILDTKFEKIVIEKETADEDGPAGTFIQYQYTGTEEEAKIAANLNQQERYQKNLLIDQFYYGCFITTDEDGQEHRTLDSKINYDNTVWQKQITENKFICSAIARLHSVLPTFEYEGHYNIDILEPMNMAGEYFGGGKEIWFPLSTHFKLQKYITEEIIPQGYITESQQSYLNQLYEDINTSVEIKIHIEELLRTYPIKSN